jgi:hypothetical protein
MASSPHRREIAATALATGRTIRAAARQAGVSERTLGGWNSEPEFAARVQAIRSSLLERCLGSMAGALSKAARTLKRLLQSPDDRVKYASAKSLIE